MAPDGSRASHLRLLSATAVAFVVAAAPPSRPRLVLHPPIITRTQTATVVATGPVGSAPATRLVGATDGGTFLRGWQRLRRVDGEWSLVLTPPALDGVYPIQLKAGGRVLGSHRWLLRVFSAGTAMRPSFATPEEVAAWWVHEIARADLVALRPWRRSDFDRRDQRLHRLYVVAYSRPGQPRGAGPAREVHHRSSGRLPRPLAPARGEHPPSLAESGCDQAAKRSLVASSYEAGSSSPVVDGSSGGTVTRSGVTSPGMNVMSTSSPGSPSSVSLRPMRIVEPGSICRPST
jgi:hypothetical protein